MKPIAVMADARKMVYDKSINDEIKKICANRMKKYPYTPCRRCRYRDPREGRSNWCMFNDCPCSWE